jgi:hypothetical protein
MHKRLKLFCGFHDFSTINFFFQIYLSLNRIWQCSSFFFWIFFFYFFSFQIYSSLINVNLVTFFHDFVGIIKLFLQLSFRIRRCSTSWHSCRSRSKFCRGRKEAKTGNRFHVKDQVDSTTDSTLLSSMIVLPYFTLNKTFRSILCFLISFYCMLIIQETPRNFCRHHRA